MLIPEDFFLIGRGRRTMAGNDLTHLSKEISNYDAVRQELNGHLKQHIPNHGEFIIHDKRYAFHTVSYGDNTSLMFDYTDKENGSEYNHVGIFVEDLPKEPLIGIYYSAKEHFKRLDNKDIPQEPTDFNKAFEQDRYFIGAGCIWWEKTVRPLDARGRQLKDDSGNLISYTKAHKLTNFSAQITKEIVRDDGAEIVRYLELTGKCGDVVLPPIEVPSDKFTAMAWVNAQWGAMPIISAGPLYKDHLRAAIQYVSPKAERHVIYSHKRWRQLFVNGSERWCYLHAGGAINGLGNNKEVEVEPGENKLRYYRLPEPPLDDDLLDKIEITLALVDEPTIAPKHVIYPLFGAVFRAPLCEALDADFTDYVTGKTGALKTAITGVIQAFFGAEFNEINLPGNWTGTANALERQAYLIKDAVFVVDDFLPRGNGGEVQRLHDKADRLLRGQANKAGRSRMRQDRTLAPEYYPRGIILATGEDVPTGHSLRGRMLITELKYGDVNLEQLSIAQKNAREGIYAEVMAAYLKWMSPKIEELKRTLADEQNKIRYEFRDMLTKVGAKGVHPKTYTTLASLYVGFTTFLDFIKEVSLGKYDEAYCKKLQADYKTTLLELAYKQIDYTETENPVNRFIKYIQTALTAGHAHVADFKNNYSPSQYNVNISNWGWQCQVHHKTTSDGEVEDVEEWRPRGDCIGWLGYEGGTTELYLDEGAAYRVAQKIAKEEGSGGLPTDKTLWKRLNEQGMLLRHETKRSTVRVRIAGSRKSVLCIDPNIINDAQKDDEGVHA